MESVLSSVTFVPVYFYVHYILFNNTGMFIVIAVKTVVCGPFSKFWRRGGGEVKGVGMTLEIGIHRFPPGVGVRWKE